LANFDPFLFSLRECSDELLKFLFLLGQGHLQQSLE